MCWKDESLENIDDRGFIKALSELFLDPMRRDVMGTAAFGRDLAEVIGRRLTTIASGMPEKVSVAVDGVDSSAASLIAMAADMVGKHDQVYFSHPCPFQLELSDISITADGSDIRVTAKVRERPDKKGEYSAARSFKAADLKSVSLSTEDPIP